MGKSSSDESNEKMRNCRIPEHLNGKKTESKNLFSNGRNVKIEQKPHHRNLLFLSNQIKP
jgi:hypothetical protein